MAKDSPLATNRTINVTIPPIELVNRDEVWEYMTKVRNLVDELEQTLHAAPPLRFAPRQGLKEE